jgi:transcriptional regulator with XRE-family HTH domain
VLTICQVEKLLLTLFIFVFGEKLKIARKNKGFTLKELGSQVGLTHSALSQIENNKNDVSKKTKIALAKALGDNFGESWLDEHISGTETPKSKKEIIEESSIEEIFSIKFGGGAGRKSKEDILRLKKLMDRKLEQMLDE